MSSFEEMMRMKRLLFDECGMPNKDDARIEWLKKIGPEATMRLAVKLLAIGDQYRAAIKEEEDDN